MIRFLIIPVFIAISSSAFVFNRANSNSPNCYNRAAERFQTHFFSSVSDDEWQGDVVPDDGGKISGCTIQQDGESITNWILNIDGVEADLGAFSEAIYKKITNDAKQQRFQGFRPGTLPPHLLPTYRTFTMDECARETVLEAMQQNNIRPFESAREDMEFESFSIPPPVVKKKKKKKRRKNAEVVEDQQASEIPAAWLSFDTMKEAINAGWKPGQSFSFVAKNVKGQKVLEDQDLEGARPVVRAGNF